MGRRLTRVGEGETGGLPIGPAPRPSPRHYDPRPHKKLAHPPPHFCGVETSLYLCDTPICVNCEDKFSKLRERDQLATGKPVHSPVSTAPIRKLAVEIGDRRGT